MTRQVCAGVPSAVSAFVLRSSDASSIWRDGARTRYDALLHWGIHADHCALQPGAKLQCKPSYLAKATVKDCSSDVVVVGRDDTGKT